MTLELMEDRVRLWREATEGRGVLRFHPVTRGQWRDLLPNPHVTPEIIAWTLAEDAYEVRLFPVGSRA